MMTVKQEAKRWVFGFEVLPGRLTAKPTRLIMEKPHFY